MDIIKFTYDPVNVTIRKEHIKGEPTDELIKESSGTSHIYTVMVKDEDDSKITLSQFRELVELDMKNQRQEYMDKLLKINADISFIHSLKEYCKINK